MFGFLIGALSLFGLVRVVSHGGCHAHGPFRRGHRWMFRRLYEHLDTSPGQEKVFEAAAEDLRGRAGQMRDELEQLRREVGRTLRAEGFDPAAVRESFARQRAHLDTLEEAVLGHLGKLHEALDPEQRERLARLVEHGPRGFMGHHRRWGAGMGHFGHHTHCRPV